MYGNGPLLHISEVDVVQGTECLLRDSIYSRAAHSSTSERIKLTSTTLPESQTGVP